MTGAFYNEHDPRAAAWLRELITAGLIAPGIVDERDIQQLKEGDLAGFTQVHLFAGIGGWSYALRLAGWPDDRPVWTGSCPCQPFSSAGAQKGTADARHLWPDMRRLVEVGRPAIVFGEQVASGLGRGWLAGVRADLEALGYAVGAADLCAASIAAPHIRQRLYWMADAAGPGREGRISQRDERGAQSARGGGACRLADAFNQRRRRGGREEARLQVVNDRGMGDAARAPSTRLRQQQHEFHAPSTPWAAFDLIPCRDNKTRRVEPGTFPLAHGVPGRVGLLRGYGNAIVPQVAAQFIRAAAEAL